MGLTTPSWKKLIVGKPCKGCRTDLGRRPRKRKNDKDMALDTWNEDRCETMENESIGYRGMGMNCKGSQGQTERAVAL